MVKGVVFDFGGVMTTSTVPQRVVALCKKVGIDWAIVNAGFEKYRHLYDGGFMSLNEMYDAIWEDANLDLPTEIQSQFLEADVASWLYRNERTQKWMASLKARGFRIGILTNMAPGFARDCFRTKFADFLALADAFVISGDEHLYKPQPEIYALLVKRIALEPAELVFVDDLEKNIAAAKACGWQGIRFVSNDQVEHDFEELLKNEK